MTNNNSTIQQFNDTIDIRPVDFSTGSDVVIRVENLWKEYRLGVVNHGTLKRDLQSWWARVRGHDDPNTRLDVNSSTVQQFNDSTAPEAPDRFWALRDVSFDVRQGEVLGIIGRNGAGKSTLLKILSRVTTPSRGEVKIRGRVASLLEVGTGFHPELTGRENIFLNGAILGMSKAEIRGKLDEIIDFSGVEKFIDTPVKRYSSGMYVRLAFAVAAHLDPEILIIDEVLAVGDAEFQKKCLGKMGEVAKGGRTVLFVSHNMQALLRMCPLAILLQDGNLECKADTNQVISEYLNRSKQTKASCWYSDEGLGNSEVRLTGVKVLSDDGISTNSFRSSRNIEVVLDVNVEKNVVDLCIGFDLLGDDETVLLRAYDTDVFSKEFSPVEIGRCHRQCVIPAAMLNGGRYKVAPRISVHNKYWIVKSEPLVEFDVILDHGRSDYWNVLDGTNRPGLVASILPWNFR